MKRVAEILNWEFPRTALADDPSVSEYMLTNKIKHS